LSTGVLLMTFGTSVTSDGVEDYLRSVYRREPPADTRAWTRAHLLRRTDAWDIDDMDWDYVRLRVPPSDGRPWSAWRTVHLATPWDPGAAGVQRDEGMTEGLQDCRIEGGKG